MGSSKKHKHHDYDPEREKGREKHKKKHSKKHHKKHKHHHKKHDKESEQNGLMMRMETISSSEDEAMQIMDSPALAGDIPPPPNISSMDDNEDRTGSNSQFSVEEANRIRAKLGLKPLRVDDNEQQQNKGKLVSYDIDDAVDSISGGQIYSKDGQEFVHVPPVNISDTKQSEKLKEKLKEKKERRQLQSRLLKGRGLADDDQDLTAADWVEKNRRNQQEKEMARKRAKMLEELDEEFGIGDLVEEEFVRDTKKGTGYSSKNLRGLTVEHDIESFQEGTSTILTLKDQGVLNTDGDTLVNVNMIQDEGYKKSNENKKYNAQTFGYNALDDKEFDDGAERSVLGKYDSELEPEKKRKKFVIGESSSVADPGRMHAIKAKLMKKQLESLETPALQLARDYYTEEEMAQFKKPKKKVRKANKRILKASDLEDMAQKTAADYWSNMNSNTSANNVDHRMDVTNSIIDDDDVEGEDLSGYRVDPEEDSYDLHLALDKARRIRQKEMLKRPTLEQIAEKISREEPDEMDDDESRGDNLSFSSKVGPITLNSTAEFCRSLGEIPTYGRSGNRGEEANELLDFEIEKKAIKRNKATASHSGAWNEVEIDDTPVDITGGEEEAPVLYEEPDVGTGVAAALKLAMGKGYLDKETKNAPSATYMRHLQAQNYSIEDKNCGDDDIQAKGKRGGGERYQGPVVEFKEKSGYKPTFKLDYVGDDGKALNQKEAFRHLSHKFHGKGSSKNKVDKRRRQTEQEVLLRHMSSTDTPLGTATLLQQKQKETQSPYIILSGKALQGATLSKHKQQ